MSNYTLKKGDIVKVTNIGITYPDYEPKAIKFGLKNFRKGVTPEKGDQGVVVGTDPHGFTPNQICVGVKLNNGKDIVIGIGGLSVVKRRNVINLDNKMFEME